MLVLRHRRERPRDRLEGCVVDQDQDVSLEGPVVSVGGEARVVFERCVGKSSYASCFRRMSHKGMGMMRLERCQ